MNRSRRIVAGAALALVAGVSGVAALALGAAPRFSAPEEFRADAARDVWTRRK